MRRPERIGSIALVAMFKVAIAEAHADGTSAELSEQWFGFDTSS